MSTTSDESPTERELTLVRLLDAPPERVFLMWTDPVHVAAWWGPKGFTNPVCEIDARTGGKMRIVMRAPDGATHPMEAVFTEFVPAQRLVFSFAATDDAGKHLLEGVTSVTFVARDGKTEITLRTKATAMSASEVRKLNGMSEGWAQTLDRLGDHVAKP